LKLPKAIENLLARLRGAKDKSDKNGSLRGENASAGTLTRSSLEKLFIEAASPVSQLVLQQYISDKKDNSLTASDVLVHVKRLLAVFEKNGLRVIGQPDEVLIFDPGAHESIDASFSPAVHAPVRVCFPGLAYDGVIIRRAGVDRLED
jgi:molecular chaperone GrpE (heat shock protein)